MDIAVLRNLQSRIGNVQSATKKLPMAGLEPARANYSPTDFKSVASTIPPHRRSAFYDGKSVFILFASDAFVLHFVLHFRALNAFRQRLNIDEHHNPSSFTRFKI